MKSPYYHRKNIPFFYEKSELEFQSDPYERYDPMVIRQTALHLADDIWGGYPMQKILDFGKAHLDDLELSQILEIGCGSGRWIASLAKEFPKSSCWGLDFSYQMLKRANEFWVENKTIEMDFSKMGFPDLLELSTTKLKNLQFGLAKANDLPFETASQNLIVHSFLIDRLGELEKGFKEMYRVLATDGTMIFVSPLNFNQKNNWDKFYPAIKIQELLIELGFELLEWQEELIVEEPMDRRGNFISWKCIGGVFLKS